MGTQRKKSARSKRPSGKSPKKAGDEFDFGEFKKIAIKAALATSMGFTAVPEAFASSRPGSRTDLESFPVNYS